MIQELLRWAGLLLCVCWSFAGFALGLKLIQDYYRERWLPGDPEEGALKQEGR